MKRTTLEKIQLVSKIARIVCKVLSICSIVAVGICLVGVICLAAGLEDFALEIAKLDITGALDKAALSKGPVYAALITDMITMAVGAVVFWFAGGYFTYEMEAGTPFTTEGADKMKRLGIISLLAAVIGSVLAGLCQAVIELTLGEGMVKINDIGISIDGTISAGALFLLLSLVFRYGAEIAEGKKDVQ